jgi:hypothetical protein
MKIKTSEDFVNFISQTMNDVKAGEVSAASGNAVANLGGKLLQMISLEMKATNFPKLTKRKPLAIEASKKKK